MNKVELLAPAGNFDCLKAAINNGADAVYLGGKNFSARAFANNFDEEELNSAIKYAHLRNVKIYVTVNTLLNEKQLENAKKMVDFYYKSNVDALLIQDLGLYYYIKNKYPDFEIHCSTQMHIHNVAGVKNAKKMGFKRVVIARESNLQLIEQACKQGIEVETFVHGAICVSYSGQCLMSAVSKNRSANKGMCAQCCRLRYDLYDETGNKIEMDTNYPLSTKDMYLIDDIPDLIKAGVSSFKIEGRMKSSAYVGYVTSLYRKAIDSYYENSEFKLNNEQIENLKVLFNRNFSNDYLRNTYNLFGQSTPNHLGIKIGEVTKCVNNRCYIKLSKQLNQFDGIRIGDFGCIVNMLYKNELLVNHGDIGDVVAVDVDYKVSGNVYKTQDFKLEESINASADKKMPLNLNVRIMPNENVTVECDGFRYESQIIAQNAIKAALDYESIYKQLSKLNETEYYLNQLSVETDNAFLPVSSLNEIRRSFIEAYNQYRLNLFSREIIYSDIEHTETDELTDEMLIEENGKINDYPINYVINQNSSYIDSKKAVIGEIGGIFEGYKDKIAYYTLNCSNSYAYEFLRKIGFKAIIVSTELTEMDVNDLIDAYMTRNNEEIHPYMLTRGNRALMYLKGKPFDKYMKDGHEYYISDGTNKYSLRIRENICEIVENSDSEYVLDNKNIRSFIIKD